MGDMMADEATNTQVETPLDMFHACAMPGAGGARRGRMRGVAIASACAVALVLLAALSATHVLAFKPADVSDAAWRAGRQAYAIAQDYDAGRISTREAAERLASVDTSYGTTRTGDHRMDAGDAHMAYCVQKLASNMRMQEIHEGPGGSGTNDMHQSMRDDMSELARAIGY